MKLPGWARDRLERHRRARRARFARRMRRDHPYQLAISDRWMDVLREEGRCGCTPGTLCSWHAARAAEGF